MSSGIHFHDPFADPDSARDPSRRLRGRLVSPVTVWTAGRGADRTGVTVSSLIVISGDPAYVVGVLSDTAELVETARESGRFVVHVAGAGDERLADRFAGVVPSPGGRFAGLAVTDGPYGPELAALGTRVGCRYDDVRAVGEALLVRGRIEQVRLEDDRAPLAYLRGRYRAVPANR